MWQSFALTYKMHTSYFPNTTVFFILSLQTTGQRCDFETGLHTHRSATQTGPFIFYHLSGTWNNNIPTNTSTCLFWALCCFQSEHPITRPSNISHWHICIQLGLVQVTVVVTASGSRYAHHNHLDLSCSVFSCMDSSVLMFLHPLIHLFSFHLSWACAWIH